MTGISDNVLTTLQKELRTHMNDITDDMVGGSCKDYSEYTHQTGLIKGLAIAERELLDLNERIENA